MLARGMVMPRPTSAPLESTSSILHRKLQVAQASISIAEKRADAARSLMDTTMRDTNARIESMERVVTDAQSARLRAEGERDSALAPDPGRLAHVRSLEMAAYKAKREHAACSPEDACHDRLEDEARFADQVARQARAYLSDGKDPTDMRVCNTHIKLTHKTSTSINATCGLDDTLGRILAERRVERSSSTTGAPPNADAQERSDNFLNSVCLDLKAGLEACTRAYDAARAQGPAAVQL